MPVGRLVFQSHFLPYSTLRSSPMPENCLYLRPLPELITLLLSLSYRLLPSVEHFRRKSALLKSAWVEKLRKRSFSRFCSLHYFPFHSPKLRTPLGYCISPRRLARMEDLVYGKFESSQGTVIPYYFGLQ